MATLTGNSGTVKVGANAIAEIRSFSVDETADTIESTAMGDTYRTFEASLKSWNGSVDVFFDDTDTNGQVALTVGSSVTVNFQVEGSTTGDHLLSGTALVTSRTINSSFDGLVEASLSLQGDGALTEGTVS
jgi:predicted secreted protein|tara:strand:- start:887 stop:1279 length:393 start_codon:yes stop_codon:yes gene_type:complete